MWGEKTCFAATQELPAIIEKVLLHLSPESQSQFSPLFLNEAPPRQTTNTVGQPCFSKLFNDAKTHLCPRAPDAV